MSYELFDFTGDEDFKKFRVFRDESGYPPLTNVEYHELKACTFLHLMKEYDDDFKKFEYIYDASHGYPEPRSEEEYLYMKYLAFKQQRGTAK